MSEGKIKDERIEGDDTIAGSGGGGAVDGGEKEKDTNKDEAKWNEPRAVEAYQVGEPVTAHAVTATKAGETENKPLKKWVHGFWDICYTNKEQTSTFCPYFCPYAFPFSCIMTGMLATKYSGNQVVCWEMDGAGIACCIGSGVSAYFFGGIFCCVHSMFYRNDIVYKYNVDIEKDIICCQCFDVCIRGICYPCSYYQMYNSIAAWESKEAASMVDAVATPTSKND